MSLSVGSFGPNQRASLSYLQRPEDWLKRMDLEEFFRDGGRAGGRITDDHIRAFYGLGQGADVAPCLINTRVTV